MLFKELERLKNVQNFILRNHKIIHTDKNNALFVDNISINKKAYFYDLYQNKLVFDFKRNITFLDVVSTQEENIEFKSIIKFDGKRYLLLTSKSNQEYCELSVYDLLTNYEKRLEEKYYWGIGDIFDNNFYFDENKFLKSLSLLTGEYDWEVALNRHGEILKIFGVVDTTLVVCWHRGHRTFGLLGIDLTSGQIRWNMDNNQLFDGRTAQLSDGKLFSTSAYGDESYYIELDIRTQHVLCYGEIPHLKSLGLRIRWINWQDNFLYFSAFYQDSFGAEAIGVLDKNSLDLLWWERVSLEKGAFLVNEAPQVAGNKLYVLDNEGTLHIFEKEQSKQ